MRAHDNYVLASAPLPKGEWKEDYIDWVIDSGCTHAVCTKRSAKQLSNTRSGRYLGQFQTPDGSRSTPQLAGDINGRLGPDMTIPLVVSDVAVQHLYKVNLLPEKVLTDNGITIINSPRVGKYLVLPDDTYRRLKTKHGLQYLRVFTKPANQALAMTRAQRRATKPGAEPAAKASTIGRPKAPTTSNSAASPATKAAPVVANKKAAAPPASKADKASAPIDVSGLGKPQATPRIAAIELLVRLHFRLCHCNYRKLRHYLEYNDLLQYFTEAEMKLFQTKILEICALCGVAKHETVPMVQTPRNEVAILFPGERVSCDVLGKFSPGIGGMLYSWLFYDWSTEKTKFYPVHLKSEFLRVYKQYQLDTGMRRGDKITGPLRLFSDTGSEFLSVAARDYYRECGTICTASPPGRNEWNGRLEGLWCYYLRTMFTIFAANPSMPYKIWVLLLPHLSNVFSTVPKTCKGKGKTLITPHEAERGVKPPKSLAKAPFWAPVVCQKHSKKGDKFGNLPGQFGRYCGMSPNTPVADLIYIPATDRVIVSYGALPQVTEINSNELWVSKFAPEAIQSLIEPRPLSGLPRKPDAMARLTEVLHPEGHERPPEDLRVLCDQLGFVHTYDRVDTDEIDPVVTGEPVGGSSEHRPTQDEDSCDGLSDPNDEDAPLLDGSQTLGDEIELTDLNSTLDLDAFDVDVNHTNFNHTMTPHKAPIHIDFGTHMAVKGSQYADLDFEQLADRCDAHGLNHKTVIRQVQPSAVIVAIQRQLKAKNQIGLMHRIRKDWQSLAMRAAIINHENGVLSGTNVLYGGRGDDSPAFVNQPQHITVPHSVHAVIDDHAQLDIGCDYAEGLLKGTGNQPLIKEVEREQMSRESASAAAQAEMPQSASRSTVTAKANVTIEVGRSLRDLKKKGNAHYDDHVKAMKDELEKTKTFEVFEDVLECDITNKNMIVNSILLFAEKYGKNNEHVKAKCRLAAQGFSQQQGLSYFDTYAPTPQDTSWRYMMSLAASHNFEVLKQIDWTSAFFMPLLQEAVYLRMPAELRQWTWNAVAGKYMEVYKRCRRAIYGLKQSGRKFSELVAADFELLGYHRSLYDPSVYVKWQPKAASGSKPPPEPDPVKRRAGFNKDDPRADNQYYDPNMPFSTGMSLETHDVQIIAVHVDDYVVVGSNMSMYEELVTHLKSEYKITEGDLDFYLGMSVERNTETRQIALGQEALLDKLAEKFDWLKTMASRKTYNVPVSPEVSFAKESMPAVPCKQRIDDARSIIGSMLYLAMKTRPDLAQAVSMMSRVVSNPSEEHFAAMQQMCVYAYNSRKQKLVFRGRNHTAGAPDLLYAFVDADYNNAATNYKATSGYCIYHNQNLIDWKSKLQSTISRSTCQAELAALSFVSCQIIHLRYLFQELGFPEQHPTVVREDNTAAAFASENDQMSRRLGHLKVAELFCRRARQLGVIKAMTIKSEHNVADIFTKACAKVKFKFHSDQLFNGPKF